jgi:ABC-type sugar transport system substrate-binding protein
MRPWVLVSLLTDKQEYQVAQAADAQAAGARLGLDVKVVYSNLDPTIQIRTINDAVGAPESSRPAAVVVETTGSAGFERVARATVEAKVGWVLVSDNPLYLDSLRREYPDRLIASAAINNQEIGRLMARMFLTLLPGGGKVLMVEGPSATAASLHRRRGADEGLKGSGVKIYKTLTADWSSAGAEKVAASWLKLMREDAARPDLLGSLNDEMAVGALQAFRTNRPAWGAIPAIGCDGLPQGGQRLVREKVLVATIVTPPTTGPGLELVAKFLRHEEVPKVTFVPVRSFPPLEELKPAPK